MQEKCSNAIPYINYNSDTADTASDKADMLNRLFESVFSTDNVFLLPLVKQYRVSMKR